ncbi:AMP-binding protein [Rhizobium sp. S-51]|uniref:AMP-binding protein n=1 Tax=Rhizobium terricola TaxID=2728849 RepID=A0A7Y0B0E9_9HYPH|nr:AMP-binding protein [Rhizobium terricola]NML76871.1 AMP-binding protein [Rhizobium terricola]
MTDTTIHGLLQRQATRYGHRPFLTFGTRTLSFAELEAMSGRAAAGFAALGVGKGDRVALMLDNCVEYLVLWFGLSRLGAVEVPLNTAHRGVVLAHMLRISKARIVVADLHHLPAVDAVRADIGWRLKTVVRGAPLPDGAVALEAVLSCTDPAPVVEVSARDPYAIMFTSGTTGPSKGALMPQGYALAAARQICDATGYGEEDCLYNALPVFHGNAQILSALPALMAGARMVLVERFSASRFWTDIRSHGCTAFNYIGTILSVLMKAPADPEDRNHGLRVMMGAGAGKGLFEAFEERFGTRLIEGYGMSEIGVPIMSDPARSRPGSCGRQTDHYDLMLVDAAGRKITTPDTPGQLLVRPKRTNGMMIEYVEMPEKTVEAFRDLWFHTGDLLQFDADGFWYFVDRDKDALRRRGENISSFEVERIIAGMETVSECAVIPVPSDLGEDDVMVCIVACEGASPDPVAVREHCRGLMADFMLPRYIRFVAELPKTPTARVEKHRLRAEGVTSDTWDADKAAVPA